MSIRQILPLQDITNLTILPDFQWINSQRQVLQLIYVAS